MVERGRQRPGHQQRRGAQQHLRQDPAVQPRRQRPGRQPVRERPQRRPGDLRLRAAQPVPVHVPAHRPGDGREHRLQLLGGLQHHPARRQLRLAVLRGQLLQLRLRQPRVCLRPLPGRRRRVGDRGIFGVDVPGGLRPRGLLRRLQPPRHRGPDVRPELPDRGLRHGVRHQRGHDRRPCRRTGRQPVLRQHLRGDLLQDLGAGAVPAHRQGVRDAERRDRATDRAVLFGGIGRSVRPAAQLQLGFRRRLHVGQCQPKPRVHGQRHLHRHADREQRQPVGHFQDPRGRRAEPAGRIDHRAGHLQRRRHGVIQRNRQRPGGRHPARLRLHVAGRLHQQRGRPALLLGRDSLPVLRPGHREHLGQLPDPDRPVAGSGQLLPDQPHCDRLPGTADRGDQGHPPEPDELVGRLERGRDGLLRRRFLAHRHVQHPGCRRGQARADGDGAGAGHRRHALPVLRLG